MGLISSTREHGLGETWVKGVFEKRAQMGRAIRSWKYRGRCRACSPILLSFIPVLTDVLVVCRPLLPSTVRFLHFSCTIRLTRMTLRQNASRPCAVRRIRVRYPPTIRRWLPRGGGVKVTSFPFCFSSRRSYRTVRKYWRGVLIDRTSTSPLEDAMLKNETTHWRQYVR